MKMNLFGLGTKSTSPAITAQRRINCYVEERREMDTTSFALIGRPGLTPFATTFGGPSRGMWAVNTLSTPLMFSVHFGTLYSMNAAGVIAAIGTINSTTGNVSMADDGTYLVLVDGTQGWWYNMATPGALTRIIDGNFTTTPKTVTWQDQYFIVTAGSGRQFQLSQIGPIDPAVWPAVQINFAGTSAGSLQAGLAANSILQLFGDIYSEFWQDAGTPDFPYALIPGSAADFGLASAWTLAKFDNSVSGLFRNKMGAVNVSRMSGFSLQKLSDQDMDQIFSTYTPAVVGQAQGFTFMIGGHPIYLIFFPDTATWIYDGLSGSWSELQSPNGGPFWGKKFAFFQGYPYVSDATTGFIYKIDPTVYADNGQNFGMEVWSKHIKSDDKFIGISNVQIDVESGVGLASGQGVNPVLDLQVSKDGGNSFYSVGFSSMGPIGEYIRRVRWNSLGSARDWVLKLRCTDPVKRVITGASAEVIGASF